MPKKKFPFGKKIVRDLYLLRANDEYKADMEKISKKYNPPSDCEVIDGKEELEFLQNPQFIEYMKESLGVMNKYNLDVIVGHLISFLAKKGHLAEITKGGKVKINLEEMTEYLLSNSGIKIINKGKNDLTLSIHSDATSKDIQKYWPEIKRSLGKRSERKKISENSERDYEILRLKIAGKKYKEIAKEINDNPKFKNQKIAYQDVSVILKRLKTKADKNMTHKDS